MLTCRVGNHTLLLHTQDWFVSKPQLPSNGTPALATLTSADTLLPTILDGPCFLELEGIMARNFLPLKEVAEVQKLLEKVQLGRIHW